MKEVEEDEELGSKNWRNHDVETMIAMRGEMVSEFLKNTKKQDKIFATLNFLTWFPPVAESTIDKIMHLHNSVRFLLVRGRER